MTRFESTDPRTIGSLGIFGGTFDPIHLAHLILAERAREELALDAVLFMPALIPPHKGNGRRIAAPEHRVAMVERAIADNPGFLLSSHELDRGGVSYTVDTLLYLRRVCPDAALTLLIGGDSARDFHTWREPERIAGLASIAVWARPEAELPAEVIPGAGYRRIEAPLVGLSSTEIRDRVARGRSIRYMTTDGVVEYIENHGLYR